MNTFDPTVPELIDIWQSAIGDIDELVSPLTDEQWNAQTPCPGWSVADIVSHVIDIESFVGGAARPEHTPDWDDLPHASGPLSQFIETGIDYRRGRSKDDVLHELRERTTIRRAQLDATPVDGEVMGLTGALVPLPRVIRTRIFDLWAHEQDIRVAIGRDGDWSTPPAMIAFQQMSSALPYVWGKGVGAPEGSTVLITVTGQDLTGEICAVVGKDGRAIACTPVEDPTVHLSVGWPDYMRLSCGRVDVHDRAFLDRVTLAGDQSLGESLLEELTITP